MELLVSIGMLARAQLCEVDCSAVRITAAGLYLIRELAD